MSSGTKGTHCRAKPEEVGEGRTGGRKQVFSTRQQVDGVHYIPSVGSKKRILRGSGCAISPP